MKKKKLVLIDANALLHRAFHALPPLKTKTGQPIQAVYGFLSVLLRIFKELKPDYVAAAFDRPEPTFRHKEFADYKAQRPKTPDELISQIDIAKGALNSFSIKTFENAGFEADDLIGSLVEKFRHNQSLEKIIIVSGDLDTLQLVEDNKVVVWTLKKGITQAAVYNEKEVEKRFSFSPKLLVDFKALRGDPSDNIPGVPSIGEKTAQKLIKKFGALEKIYEALEKKPEQFSDFSTRILEILRSYKEQAFFSKELVSIRRDIEIDATLEELSFEVDAKKLKKLFDKYGFFSLWQRAKEIFGFEKKAESTESGELRVKPLPVCLSDLEKKLDFSKAIFLYMAQPTELSGTIFGNRQRLEILNEKNYFLLEGDLKKAILWFLEKESQIYLYDFKSFLDIFDEGEIINLPKIKAKIFDVKLASWLLNPDKVEFKLEKDYSRVFKKEIKSPKIFSLKELSSYFEEKIKKENLSDILFKIEIPLVSILVKMEKRGIKIRKSYLLKLKENLNSKLQTLRKEIFKLVGEEFNINSPSQVSQILFSKLNINPKGLKHTSGGLISTQIDELKKIIDSHPVVEKIIIYKEIYKMISTYVDGILSKIDSKERIHTEFVQTGASTGRLVSKNPNLQNIPTKNESLAKEFRKIFTPSKDFLFVSFDYSQIELRVVAILSKDKSLQKAFLENKDIHAETAKRIFSLGGKQPSSNQRRIAKALNFGLLYGMGKRSFAETAKISLKEAENFIEKYFEEFPTLREFQENLLKEARKKKWVMTLFGRKRWLPEIDTHNPKYRSQAERAALNFPVQGTAADIIKLAMVKIDEFLRKKSWNEKVFFVLQIHDELIFEIEKSIIKEAKEEIKRIMEKVVDLSVPLEVKVKEGNSLAF